MSFVFLLSRISGYFSNCINKLHESYPDAAISVVVVPNSPNAPFETTLNKKIKVAKKTDFANARELEAFVIDNNNSPDFIYLSIWRDTIYTSIARKYRLSAVVAVGIDNQWKGTLRQIFLTFVASLTVKRIVSHIMVPGVRQYEYARRLGYNHANIIRNMLSADSEYYEKIYQQRKEKKGNVRELVFIGGMHEAKGVNELVEAFTQLADKFLNWKLTLIGGGILTDRYKNQHKSIKVVGFIQPSQLKSYLMQASVFCLPSYFEAHGVVIHEAACMGLPIVASRVCGATDAFLVDGYNGYLCKEKSTESLKKSLTSVMSLSDEDLCLFGKRSFDLSKQINPQIWVNSIAFALKNKNNIFP